MNMLEAERGIVGCVQGERVLERNYENLACLTRII